MKLIDCRTALLSAALLAPAIASAECDTSRDDSGAYLATCRFTIEEKLRPHEFEVKFLSDTVRFELKLPDVTVDKYKYFLSGNNVDVSIDIRNDGQVSTRATTVVVTLQVWDPAHNMQYGQDIEVTATVPVIAPGATSRVYLTTVSLPNTVEDFDIVAAGFVDPPTSAQPVHGSLHEGDETNNAKMHTCRVFGENPVLIPPPPPVCD